MYATPCERVAMNAEDYTGGDATMESPSHTDAQNGRRASPAVGKTRGAGLPPRRAKRAESSSGDDDENACLLIRSPDRRATEGMRDEGACSSAYSESDGDDCASRERLRGLSTQAVLERGRGAESGMEPGEGARAARSERNRAALQLSSSPSPSPTHFQAKELEYKDLARYFHLPIAEAAKQLGICVTVLKKRCRRHGVLRWPHRKLKSLDKLKEKLEREEAVSADKQYYQAEIHSIVQKKDMLFRTSTPGDAVNEGGADTNEEAQKRGLVHPEAIGSAAFGPGVLPGVGAPSANNRPGNLQHPDMRHGSTQQAQIEHAVHAAHGIMPAAQHPYSIPVPFCGMYGCDCYLTGGISTHGFHPPLTSRPGAYYAPQAPPGSQAIPHHGGAYPYAYAAFPSTAAHPMIQVHMLDQSKAGVPGPSNSDVFRSHHSKDALDSGAGSTSSGANPAMRKVRSFAPHYGDVDLDSTPSLALKTDARGSHPNGMPYYPHGQGYIYGLHGQGRGGAHGDVGYERHVLSPYWPDASQQALANGKLVTTYNQTTYHHHMHASVEKQMRAMSRVDRGNDSSQPLGQEQADGVGGSARPSWSDNRSPQTTAGRDAVNWQETPKRPMLSRSPAESSDGDKVLEIRETRAFADVGALKSAMKDMLEDERGGTGGQVGEPSQPTRSDSNVAHEDNPDPGSDREHGSGTAGEKRTRKSDNMAQAAARKSQDIQGGWNARDTNGDERQASPSLSGMVDGDVMLDTEGAAGSSGDSKDDASKAGASSKETTPNDSSSPSPSEEDANGTGSGSGSGSNSVAGSKVGEVPSKEDVALERERCCVVMPQAVLEDGNANAFASSGRGASGGLGSSAKRARTSSGCDVGGEKKKRSARRRSEGVAFAEFGIEGVDADESAMNHDNDGADVRDAGEVGGGPASAGGTLGNPANMSSRFENVVRQVTALRATVWSVDLDLRVTSAAGPRVLLSEAGVPGLGRSVDDGMREWYRRARRGDRQERVVSGSTGQRFLHILAPLRTRGSHEIMGVSGLLVELRETALS